MKVSCPVCRKEVEWEKSLFRPFCSEVCKQRDLGNWATERYRIPGSSQEEASQNKKEEE